MEAAPAAPDPAKSPLAPSHRSPGGKGHGDSQAMAMPPGRCPIPTHLALATHSMVTSEVPATTLVFLGGTMMVGAMGSAGPPTSEGQRDKPSAHPPHPGVPQLPASPMGHPKPRVCPAWHGGDKGGRDQRAIGSAAPWEGRAGPAHHPGIMALSPSPLLPQESLAPPAPAQLPAGRQEGDGEYIKQNDCNNKKPSCRRCKNAIGSKAADRAESINMGSGLFIAHGDAEKQINGAGGEGGRAKERDKPPHGATGGDEG